MNCPKCKNPVDENSNECEWCGNKIIPDSQIVNSVLKKNNFWFYIKIRYFVYILILVLSILLSINNDDIPFQLIVLVGIVIYELLVYIKRKNKTE